MTEIERYRPQPTEVDSWTRVLAPVADLAAKIGGTFFVPDSLRGNTAAVAAAILTGREMGLGPMTSLRHIHVIKGRPGQSAELMRALVLARGHKIRYVETSDTRCVVEGRRTDEPDWTRVVFTADQARRAKIVLGDYPEDKLVARATARLCRRLFADVVAGMPYTTDELEDLDGRPGPRADNGTAAADSAPTRRTAQRRTKTPAAPSATPPASAAPIGREDGPAGPAVADGGPGRAVRPVSRAEAGQAPRANVPEPALPGEPGYGQPTGSEPDEPSVEVAGEAGRATDQQGGPVMVRPGQLKKIQATFTTAGWTDRADRLRAASALVGRPLSSANELTTDEAATLIDTLAMVADGPDPADRLTELLEAVERAESGAGSVQAADDDGERVDVGGDR